MFGRKKEGKYDNPSSMAPQTSKPIFDGTGAISEDVEAQKVVNARNARKYADCYDEGDYDTILRMLHPEGDFASLWGVYHGAVEFRVMLAEEARLKPTWNRGTGTGPGGFKQVTDNIFERQGTAHLNRGGIYRPYDYVKPVYIRETLVMRNGRIKNRVFQQLVETQIFFLGVSA
jgi:hypothetical protein